MFRSDVEKILGSPTGIEQYSYAVNDVTAKLHYDGLDLSVGFDQEDDWRFVTLSVSKKAPNWFIKNKSSRNTK